jgi:uncharacterized membrane protein YedE/YeeE
LTVHTFLLCLAVGAGAIALWLDFRLPKLMPWSMKRLLVHIVLALVVVYLVGPAMTLVTSSQLPAAGLAAVFGIALPVLVYEFLVGVWMIRLAQASGAGFRS